MAIRNLEVDAKLPDSWVTEGEAIPGGEGKVAGKGGQVVSKMQKVLVKQIDKLADVVALYDGDEAKFVTAMNGFLKAQKIQNEYQARLAKVKPSDLTEEQKIERAVSAMVRTGLFGIEEARELVIKRAEAGQLR